jgi:hypothetical protein
MSLRPSFECPLWVKSRQIAARLNPSVVRYGSKADKNRLSAFVRQMPEADMILKAKEKTASRRRACQSLV